MAKLKVRKGDRVRSIEHAVRHVTGSADNDYHKGPRTQNARRLKEMRKKFGSEYTRKMVRNARTYTPVREVPQQTREARLAIRKRWLGT